MARWLVDVLRDPQLVGLDQLLREDVRFRSPYADYSGREDVDHLLRLIAGVLADVRVAGPEPAPRPLPATRTTRFEATVNATPLQGVLAEDLDAEGRLTEAMLLLRPYHGLREAMGVMSAELTASPLPSRRR
jgi:hypothetical protein